MLPLNRKLIDIISLSVVVATVGGIALVNLFQPNRPTVSTTENRTLAEMPTFSLEALADGSYFRGISAYISDTFPERDKLVALSKKMDTLKGVEYRIDGGDAFILLSTTGDVNNEDSADDGADDVLKAAFDSLSQKEETPEETSKESSPSHATGELETETGDSAPDENPSIDTNENSPDDTDMDFPINTDDADTDSPVATDENPPDDADTDSPVDTDENPSDDNADAEPSYEVRGLTLSRETLRLTVGSGAVVYAYLDTDSPTPGNVKWSVSDSSVASLSINPNGGIDVKGLKEGTCTLTCRYDDEIRTTCAVTVAAITAVTQTQNDANADFLTNGMFIYGDAVHTPAYYSAVNAGYYAQTAAYYKSLFGEDVRMNVVVAPVSSVVVDNEAVQSKIANQKDILDKMAALMDPSVNFVDAYTPIYEHRNEYLYFKSDHHWTQRGAYYAYTAFAESIGLTPTPLEDFDYQIRNESYSGSMYMYTQDARVKNFTDVIEAFVSKKPHTMTVTGSNGVTYHYDSSVVTTNDTYVTFIAGDNPYTVINVPENPQDFNVLVLKDSFGNAFVPFLCEHYGNIIVVDVRYSSFNIYEQLKDYGLSDILFVNNIQAANAYTWSKMYLAAVGVNLDG